MVFIWHKADRRLLLINSREEKRVIMTLVSVSKRKPPDCFYAAALCLHLLLWISRSVSGEEQHQFSVEVRFFFFFPLIARPSLLLPSTSSASAWKTTYMQAGSARCGSVWSWWRHYEMQIKIFSSLDPSFIVKQLIWGCYIAVLELDMMLVFPFMAGHREVRLGDVLTASHNVKED